jgi:hypothetical protein
MTPTPTPTTIRRIKFPVELWETEVVKRKNK